MNEMDIIQKLNNLLSQIDTKKIDGKSYPSTYIIGCPRSGTTALLQYLASTEIWSYPSNLVTRFSSLPMMGLLTQKLLFSPDYGLIGMNDDVDFSSELGRSSGPLNTNEFFHFYRRFFPNNDIRYLNIDELNRVKIDEMLHEISLFTSVENKPYLSKGLMFQYNLEYFHNKMKDEIFIYIKRDDLYVMQSIYYARKKQNSLDDWWSAKPSNFECLKEKNVYEQIAGQVLHTNLEIENALKLIPDNNKLVISYEEFIENPFGVINALSEKYAKHGIELSCEYISNSKLFNGNVKKVNDEIWSEFKSALKSVRNAIQ